MKPRPWIKEDQETGILTCERCGTRDLCRLADLWDWAVERFRHAHKDCKEKEIK